MINPQNDIEAWEAYAKDRWVYNKLDLSLKLNYHAGPACVPIKKSGNFCIRPIMNLNGMGIGAVKKRLNVTVHASEMENHAHVPPGYFWVEWFDGPHISVDFTKNPDTKKWEAFSAIQGFHENDDSNLTKFIRWKVVKPELDYNLPNWVHKIKTEKYLNIEFRQGKIIEIHLRSGNDSFWSCALGTEILPVWKNVKYNKMETSMKFIPNFYEGLARYEASGHQTDVRIGYYVDE